MTVDVRPVTLLVVRDVLGAGLLGALAEMERCEPAFPLDGESLAERLRAALRCARA